MPEVSVLVAIEGGGRQIEPALRSLSPASQRNVAESDYEVVAVEKPTAEPLGATRLSELVSNARYFSFGGEGTPLELAHERSRGSVIGLMDAPCIVTPRLIEHVLDAVRLAEHPIVLVPAYELDLREPGSIGGKRDAYELFDSSRFGSSNPNGYLGRVRGAKLFFCKRAMLDALAHDLEWEGLSCQKAYVRLAARRECELIALVGEGCFELAAHESSAAAGPVPRAKARRATVFGAVSGQAQAYFRDAIGRAAIYEMVSHQAAKEPWPLDPIPRKADGGARPVPSEGPERPRLSIVVVVFRMARQAENTIHSLGARHQHNVREGDYEIVVVENHSSDMLGEEAARAAAPNVRYFAREDRGVSPVPALNFGIAQARGDVIGFMIDGARMVTPRVVEHVFRALALRQKPLVVVPGYHLGPDRQHVSSQQGYSRAVEVELLRGIDWKQSGYRLFEIGCFDDTTENGFLSPLLESTCLFAARSCVEAIGGVDERFDLAGGGIVNLDLFERLCRLDDTRLVVLWGEGAFHQFHGGVSSGSGEERERMLESFRRQYRDLRGREYATWEREPVLFGPNTAVGHDLLARAAELGRINYLLRHAEGLPQWPRR